MTSPDTDDLLLERICTAFEKAGELGKNELDIDEFMKYSNYQGFDPIIVLDQLRGREDLVTIGQNGMISLTDSGIKECKDEKWKKPLGGGTHEVQSS